MNEEIKEDNNCIVKAFENNPISIISENIDNKKIYYFKASDIGKALELSNIAVSIQHYDEDERVIRKAYDTEKRMQNTTFLTSQGVYRLLYNSKKDVAKKFRKWAGNILDDIIFNESKELKLQLEENEKKVKLLENKVEEKAQEIIQIKKVNKLIEKRWYNTEPGDTVYVFNNDSKLINIGKTKNIAKREINYLGTNQTGNMVHVRNCYDCNLTEKVLHHILDKYRQHKNMEWFDISEELAIYIVDVTCTFLDSFIGFSDNLLTSGLKEGLESALNTLKKELPEEKQIDTNIKTVQIEKIDLQVNYFDKFLNECCEIGDHTYSEHPYDLIGCFILWNKSRITQKDRTNFNNYMKQKFKTNLMYFEKFDTVLRVFIGVRLKKFVYKPNDPDNLTYFDEFFNEQCHTGYTFKISCSEFNEEYTKWLKARYPDFVLNNQEIINLKYYINKQFLFDKISIPGHTNVDGILGFQLKTNDKPRYGILFSKRKSITQTDTVTNEIVKFKSLTSASRILKISTQELSLYIKNKILINNRLLEYDD